MAKIGTKLKKRHLRASAEPLEALHQMFDPATGIVTIYDGRRKIWEGHGKEGDFYVVSWKNGKYNVNKRRLPYRKHNFLMWVFGFPKNLQFEDERTYDEQLTNCRYEHMAEPGYQEYQYAGIGYCFAFYSTAAEPTPQRVAAWVTPNVERKKAKEILGIKGLNIAGMGDFGDDSLSRELMNRFGMKIQDFEDINRDLFD